MRALSKHPDWETDPVVLTCLYCGKQFKALRGASLVCLCGETLKVSP